MKDNLGDRMKGYEAVYDAVFPTKSYVIVRLDGKAFHTFTRGLIWPNIELKKLFVVVTSQLVNEVQNCLFGYHQSDEISLVITDDIKDTTGAYFGNRLQKICSITASLATYWFNLYLPSTSLPIKPALFDSRAFVIPKDDIPNYFVWRIKDNERNVIQSLGQSKLSHKQLQGMSNKQLMQLPEIEYSYNNLSNGIKYGTIVTGGLSTVLEQPMNYYDIETVLNFQIAMKQEEI